MNSIADWSYEDFLTYLLLMGAKADLIVSDNEKDTIIQKVGEDKYKKIKRFFDTQNDAQHIDVVSDLYKRFESQIGGKENLIKAVKEVIDADHQPEHAMDHYLMVMLKRIL
jgi:hypothetical protein